MKRSKQIASLALALCFVVPALALAGTGPAGHGHHHGATADASPIGEPGKLQDVKREIRIEMSDAMRFTPSQLKVQKGETLKIIVHNAGKQRHELSLGTKKDLLEHLEMMRRFPMMEHDEPSSVTLDAGKQSEIIWKFSQAGTVDFACLIPGHYEAGMKGRFTVKGH